MAHTIRRFQEDQAVLLADQIQSNAGETVSVDRVLTVLQAQGVVSDYTYWRKLPEVLDKLGFEYDEIVEVAP